MLIKFMGCIEIVDVDKGRTIFSNSSRESESNLDTSAQSAQGPVKFDGLKAESDLDNESVSKNHKSRNFSVLSQTQELNLPDVSQASSILSWKNANAN
jgi:hypothetical protein